jgi:hypothetical protein
MIGDDWAGVAAVRVVESRFQMGGKFTREFGIEGLPYHFALYTLTALVF